MLESDAVCQIVCQICRIVSPSVCRKTDDGDCPVVGSGPGNFSTCGHGVAAVMYFSPSLFDGGLWR